LHELSIACSLVKTAVDEAARHGVTHVVKMDVVLGALAGVELEALRFCFPAVAQGTVCEGAVLDIEDCGRDRSLSHLRVRLRGA
jgi:hydrogenase nickel incorporation protein HypA/HybF